MGLYDEMKILAPLNKPEHNEYTWQTKDWDCAMDRYVVTPEGRLRVVVMNWGDLIRDDSIIGFHFEPEVVGEEDSDYTGRIEVVAGEPSGLIEYWLEFRAGWLVNKGEIVY